MDRLIQHWDAVRDGDLRICPARGVAYQRDMTKGRVAYDDLYFENYVRLEGKPIACAINDGRIALVNKYLARPPFSPEERVLDVGIGSGEFIKRRGANTYGTDVNPRAVAWLKEQGLHGPDLSQFRAFTFWDVLEHVDNPDQYFRNIADGSLLCTSIPIIDDLTKVRDSKHYKPGEHFYYWTEAGFVAWMAEYRFRLLERQDFEIAAGRESILSFAFRRQLPGYHETVDQYKELHSRFYGASAWQYLDAIAYEVKTLKPRSILDYGCGRSDLVAHFWRDGERRIARYDPAIPQWKEMPDGAFDLVLCTDVMEHIPMHDVERVLKEIRAKSGRALFTISMKPARAKLPDGRNAHVTLMTVDEWMRWVKSVFGRAERIATQWEHILMLRTYGAR